MAELAIDRLPLSRLPPMLSMADAPTRLPPSRNDAGDLTVWHETRGGKWGWHYTMRGMRQLVHMRFDPTVAGVTENLPPACKRVGRRNVVPARWEGIVAAHTRADGTTSSLEYAIVDGWFDLRSCTGAGVRRFAVRLEELVPELVYATRTCERECGDGRADALLVAMPPGRLAALPEAPTTLPFDPPLRAATVPLGEAAGGAVSVLVDPCGLWRWQQGVLRRPADPGVLVTDQRADKRKNEPLGFWLSIDASHAVADAAPVAVAYLWQVGSDVTFSPIAPSEVQAVATGCAPGEP